MKRILIKIAYNGSRYKGWQSNEKKLSIENILNAALSKATGEDIHVIGTSRTDSGVHANCNFAAFDTNSDIVTTKYPYILNNLLPKDIAVLESKQVDDNFHPRKCHSIKTYIYRIHNTKIRNPLKEWNAHFVYYDIDIDKMRIAANYLIGTHDFTSFANPESQLIENAKKSGIPLDNVTTREIYSIDITKNDDIIEFIIKGNGFLYNMVRIICGTLLKVGMGMFKPEYVKEILDKKNRKYAGFTLPANGLTLENIEFK